MIKICFVTTIYLTYHCFLKEFTKYLYSTGEFDVSLICDRDSVDKSDLPEFVHYFPVEMKRGISLSGISAVGKFRSIFLKENFDIIQYSTPNAAFYAALASKSAGTPVRLYCQWGIRYMGFEGWKRALFKMIEKITCAYSTFIEAESHGIRSFALAEGLYDDARSVVIWNGSACGVNLTRFDASKRKLWREEVRSRFSFVEEDVVFAFAGRLTRDKGVNELLSAFLSIEQPHVKLLAMGDLDDETSLDPELYRNAQQDSRVFFTGNVNGIEQYYAASDVFVAPSYREGFGLVVVEAEAMGLPAIVSNVPGQVDAVIPDVTGLLCEVKDAETLKTAMEDLIHDPQKRLTMGQTAERYARGYYEQGQLFRHLKEHREQLYQRYGQNG